MSLLSRLVLRVLTGGGVFVSISMVDKHAGVIVATPGWALLGCTSRQALRGQALAWVILFRPSSLSGGAGGLGC